MPTHPIHLLITRLSPSQRASFALFIANDPSPSPSGPPKGSPSGSPKGSPSGSPKGSQSDSPKGSQNGSPKGSQSGSPKGSPSGSPKANPTSATPPNPPTPLTPGTLIMAEGTPMSGYALRFVRDHRPGSARGTLRAPRAVYIGEVDAKLLTDPPGSTRRRGGGPEGDQRPRGLLERVAKMCPVPGVSADFRSPVNDTTNRRCQEWTFEFVNKLIQLKYLEPAALEIIQKHRDTPDHGIGLRKVVPGQGVERKGKRMVLGSAGGSGSLSGTASGRSSVEKQSDWYKAKD